MAVSTWTLIIGIAAVAFAIGTNFFVARDEQIGPLRDELNINIGIGIAGLIFSIIFPPLGIIALLVSAMLNIHSSAQETDHAKHNWLIGSAFATMTGAILIVLSMLYKGVDRLTPGIEIPMITKIATLLGLVAVFGSALSNFIIAGRHTDQTTRNELYGASALSFTSLILLPFSALLIRSYPTIGIIFALLSIAAVVVSLVLNGIVAGHETDEDAHNWIIITSIAQIIGVILFTAAIYYLGTVKAFPAVTGLRQAYAPAKAQYRDILEGIEEPLFPAPAARERQTLETLQQLQSQQAAEYLRRLEAE